MSMRAILKKISFNRLPTLGLMEGNQRIRRFTEYQGLPGYRDTLRRFETKEEEDQFNYVKNTRFILTRFKQPDEFEKYDELVRDEIRRSEIELEKQHYEAMERQKHIEYEIDDKKLEEEVEAIIRSGDLSLSKIGCQMI
ncbi:hypothetical protein MKX03_013447 [Papaver bracteatum]|nr:hypothetical protein MKX03_013447 [Papaver bracteatum]